MSKLSIMALSFEQIRWMRRVESVEVSVNRSQGDEMT